MGALLVAVDLVAPPFCPRPLRGLYERLIGQRARAEVARWHEAWPDTDKPWTETA